MMRSPESPNKPGLVEKPFFGPRTKREQRLSADFSDKASYLILLKWASPVAARNDKGEVKLQMQQL